MPLDHLRASSREELIQYASRLEWMMEEILRNDVDVESVRFLQREFDSLKKPLLENSRRRYG